MALLAHISKYCSDRKGLTVRSRKENILFDATCKKEILDVNIFCEFDNLRRRS